MVIFLKKSAELHHAESFTAFSILASEYMKEILGVVNSAFSSTSSLGPFWGIFLGKWNYRLLWRLPMTSNFELGAEKTVLTVHLG